MQKKYNWSVFGLLLLGMVLTGCDDTWQADNSQLTESKENLENELEINQTDSYNYVDQTDKNSKPEITQPALVNENLVVDSQKCIGCGKCVQTASANFEMKNGSAVVYSQEGIDSIKVTNAIKNCPVKAISINS